MATPDTPAPNSSEDPLPPLPQPSAPVVSTVKDEQWRAMHDVLQNIYAFRTEDGDEPSKIFARKVNKRVLPDYYEVIKEPIALSTIKARIASREYRTFEQFVRDFALIPHNAQVYNRPESGAYIDSLVIKDVLEKELKKLVDRGMITEASSKLPFLGEIPAADELPPAAREEDEEDEEEDDADGDEEEDSDEEEKKPKRKPGRPSLASLKRDAPTKGDKAQDDDDPEARRKRGRPPRVDTPLEARIKNVMKGMRRSKNEDNQMKASHFDRLPDKALWPQYFDEIKQPIALDTLKKKLKRKKYTSMDQFLRDVELMFENAKLYNTDDSQIYKDAVDLQNETRHLVEEEMKKPDSEYAMEDGKVPLPGGILHNGELWKVGDWVHIQNSNDLTKPIIAQIFRTWQDQDNKKWVNACWYYRPEQTVHRFDRHFYESEVFKTGQYRDHSIDEVIDRCYVMFITRFNKGRPRGFPADKEAYLCEARYNEEKYRLNKIKTWASCVPDEVRDKDYEMDLFQMPRKMRKVPSPIKYLFKPDEQKETDDMPKPVWGAANAPPKIGAVHCRPREPRDSPPPEPTPSPPPPAPMSYPRPLPSAQPRRDFASAARSDSSSGMAKIRPPNIEMPPRIVPNPNLIVGATNTAHSAEQVATPISMMPIQYQHTSTASTPSRGHSSSASQPNYASQNNLSATASRPATLSRMSSATSQQPQYAQQANNGPMGNSNFPSRPPQHGMPQPGYQQSAQFECFRLPDSVDDMIPEGVREQFHRDSLGRVLFFTSPPLNTTRVGSMATMGHSAKYLAWRANREEEQEAGKRKRTEQNGGPTEEDDLKRQRLEQASRQAHVDGEVDTITTSLLDVQERLVDGLIADYKRGYGPRWQEMLVEGLERLPAPISD